MTEARLLMNESASFDRVLRTVKMLGIAHEFSRSVFQVYVTGTETEVTGLSDNLHASGVPHRMYVHAATHTPTGWYVPESSNV